MFILQETNPCVTFFFFPFWVSGLLFFFFFFSLDCCYFHVWFKHAIYEQVGQRSVEGFVHSQM